MSAHRFFLTAKVRPGDHAQALPLAEADVHHAVDVLRLRAGEAIEVVEPEGQVLRAEVAEVARHGVSARIVGEVVSAPLPHVTLFQGVAKGDKMDDVVRQAVEVGADGVVPVLMARSVVRLEGRKRAERGERWRRVALAAAKQAKRTTVPQVSDPLSLRDALPLLADFDGAVVLWEESQGLGVVEAARRCAASPESRIAVVVGPEGGLTAEEVAALRNVGATVASLGPTILRTETAAVVGLALVIGALGGLGSTGE